jgi:hypothetical protein
MKKMEKNGVFEGGWDFGILGKNGGKERNGGTDGGVWWWGRAMVMCRWCGN